MEIDELIPKKDSVEAIKSIPPVAPPNPTELLELSTIPVAPKTTVEQDKVAESLRGFNTTWENTQALIAKSVVFTTCVMVLVKAAAGFFFPALDSQINNIIPSEWWTILGLVIGFYFGRTNHARQGDTNPK